MGTNTSVPLTRLPSAYPAFLAPGFTEVLNSLFCFWRKFAGKLTFRLVSCHASDFRHYDFECLATVAKEIVNKINNIMELRSSPKKQEYKRYKERKTHNPFKRHSFSFS